jgi:hypothetical protein
MKTMTGKHDHPNKISAIFARATLVAGFLFAAASGLAQGLPGGGGGGGGGTTYTPLDSWSFNDHTNWTSDNGYFPISFTNLAFSPLGNFQSLVVDTNVSALLQYRVVETNGATNLTVNIGTVTFWFAPGSWSGTNAGGTGPGEYGRLFETGAYTTNSSYGWWSIYVDPAGANLYFSAQTNNSSGTFTNYLSVPIAWTTNYFHFIALTYSATNTALYLDGVLATNGSGLTVYPGQNALTNGFFVGSDFTGTYQAHGLFNNVATYNVPLDAGTIQGIYSAQYPLYMMNPYNSAMETIVSGSSSPTFTNNYFDAISGAGNLQWDGYASTCSYGTNALNVWISNISATNAGNGTMNVTFTIQGGADGYAYDVFAGGYLSSPLSSRYWAWLGQGYHCNTYTVNINSPIAFLILGTPQDTSGYGLTDAYENLILHIDPNGAQTDAYGVPYAWYAMNGLSISSATQDPDHDGLLNYQEYFYGTKPIVSEGFSIWVSTPNGTTSIP